VDNQDAHDHHLVAPRSAGVAWTARAVGPWWAEIIIDRAWA
jgi:hypothetical protein